MTQMMAFWKHYADALDAARGHAMKAMRRGDLAAAERWRKLAAREAAQQRQLASLIDLELSNAKTERRICMALSLLKQDEAYNRRQLRKTLRRQAGRLC